VVINRSALVINRRFNGITVFIVKQKDFLALN